MINIVLVLILLLTLCGAVSYIVKSKKNGQKCIGCPSGCHCHTSEGGNTDCRCKTGHSSSGE